MSQFRLMKNVSYLKDDGIVQVDFYMRGENARCPAFIPEPPTISRSAHPVPDSPFASSPPFPPPLSYAPAASREQPWSAGEKRGEEEEDESEEEEEEDEEEEEEEDEEEEEENLPFRSTRDFIFPDGDNIRQIDFYMRDATMPAWTDPPALIDLGIGSLCIEGQEGEDEEGWVLMEFWDEKEDWVWVDS